jgi:uncharacterized protein DUF6424
MPVRPWVHKAAMSITVTAVVLGGMTAESLVLPRHGHAPPSPPSARRRPTPPSSVPAADRPRPAAGVTPAPASGKLPGTPHRPSEPILEAPVADAHTEHEDHPWTIEIAGHPRRADSPEYVKSRALMNKITREVPGFSYYGPPPWQDHHGGGLWVKDAGGWFLLRNLAGIEWSAQFAADPARVDLLRQNARRLYEAFPDAVAELGIRDLLDTPITDAEGIARWTDSICNASVPLTPALHTGVLPHGGGLHHYPSPVCEINTFRRDDFQLWVTDSEGHPAAVVPVAPRGAGDGRLHVLYTHPGSALHAEHQAAAMAGQPHILHAGHPLARQAFAAQA